MDTKTPDAKSGRPDTSSSQSKGGDLDRGDAEAATKMQGREGGGDSGGGAYPNPHTGKEGANGNEGWMGHGGESDVDYYGHGRLGGKDVGDNANAPAKGATDD